MKQFNKYCCVVVTVATSIAFTATPAQCVKEEVTVYHHQFVDELIDAIPVPTPTVTPVPITTASPGPTEEPIPTYKIKLSKALQRHTYKMCEKYEVVDHYELVLALMRKESNYDASAVSETSDYGITQINVCNHRDLHEKLGINNFLDPYQGIEAGVYMLSIYLQKYESENMALMCYNRGERGAKELQKSGQSSTEYSRSIIGIKKDIYINK